MNINEKMRLHKWSQDMADQKSSCLSQIKWCKMKGISATTFRYRCRQVRLAMKEKFQEKDPENTAIVPTKVRAETPSATKPIRMQKIFSKAGKLTRPSILLFMVPTRKMTGQTRRSGRK